MQIVIDFLQRKFKKPKDRATSTMNVETTKTKIYTFLTFMKSLISMAVDYGRGNEQPHKSEKT